MELPVSFEDIEQSRNAPEVDGCIPIFHNRIIEDLAKSEETGKREYKEVAYVKVLSPGNDKEIPDFRVTDKHKKRWPIQWKAFISDEEVAFEGYPLKKWQGSPSKARLNISACRISPLSKSNVPKKYIQSLLSSRPTVCCIERLKRCCLTALKIKSVLLRIVRCSGVCLPESFLTSV